VRAEDVDGDAARQLGDVELEWIPEPAGGDGDDQKKRGDREHDERRSPSPGGLGERRSRRARFRVAIGIRLESVLRRGGVSG
jgi:hypothetical protein